MRHCIISETEPYPTHFIYSFLYKATFDRGSPAATATSHQPFNFSRLTTLLWLRFRFVVISWWICLSLCLSLACWTPDEFIVEGRHWHHGVKHAETARKHQPRPRPCPALNQNHVSEPRGGINWLSAHILSLQRLGNFHAHSLYHLQCARLYLACPTSFATAHHGALLTHAYYIQGSESNITVLAPGPHAPAPIFDNHMGRYAVTFRAASGERDV